MVVVVVKYHTRVKLDEVLHLSCGNVKHNGVIDFDKGVRVADGATIVCDDERHTLWANLDTLNTAQLVLEHNKPRNHCNKHVLAALLHIPI